MTNQEIARSIVTAPCDHANYDVAVCFDCATQRIRLALDAKDAEPVSALLEQTRLATEVARLRAALERVAETRCAICDPRAHFNHECVHKIARAALEGK